MPSLVVALTQLPPGVEGGRWLEQVAHDAGELPGVRPGRALEAIDERGNWISLNDVEPGDVRGLLSYVREREGMDGAPVVGASLRRELWDYEVVSVPEVARAEDDVAGAIVSCVWWTPAPGAEDDLNAWYDNEHIPLLMEVPGWLRIRRFKRDVGGAPQYFAIHDIEDARALGDPRRKRVRTTPWRDRVVRHRLQYEARMYARPEQEGL
jgi:hypothetical protein